MRRINILADKSLLAAFVEDTHGIEPRHVQAAMRDSELEPPRSLHGKKLLIGSVAGTLLLSALAAGWLLDRPQAPPRQVASADIANDTVQTQDSPSPEPAPAAPAQKIAALPPAEEPDHTPATGDETAQAAVAADTPPPSGRQQTSRRQKTCRRPCPLPQRAPALPAANRACSSNA